MTVLFKKKQVIVVALVLLIAVAGYLNVSYKKDTQTAVKPVAVTSVDTAKKLGEAKFVSGSTDTAIPQVAEANAMIAQAKILKEQTRSKSIEMLNAIVDKQSSTSEAKTNAQKQIIQTTKDMQNESAIQNLIIAKGFASSVVFINDGTVNVVVQYAKDLIPTDVAKVQDIVVTQTGVTADKIKVTGVK